MRQCFEIQNTGIRINMLFENGLKKSEKVLEERNQNNEKY
jgi:hypothetical protein